MTNKMKELLQEQTTADQADNSDSKNGVTTSTPNWEREQIPGTPFWIVGNNDKGYNIIMGKWKLTQEEIYNDVQAPLQQLAHHWLQNNTYNTILSMIICVTTDIEKQKQN